MGIILLISGLTPVWFLQTFFWQAMQYRLPLNLVLFIQQNLATLYGTDAEQVWQMSFCFGFWLS